MPSLSVGASSSRVALPAGTVVIVYNTGVERGLCAARRLGRDGDERQRRDPAGLVARLHRRDDDLSGGDRDGGNDVAQSLGRRGPADRRGRRRLERRIGPDRVGRLAERQRRHGAGDCRRNRAQGRRLGGDATGVRDLLAVDAAGVSRVSSCAGDRIEHDRRGDSGRQLDRARGRQRRHGARQRCRHAERAGDHGARQCLGRRGTRQRHVLAGDPAGFARDPAGIVGRRRHHRRRDPGVGPVDGQPDPDQWRRRQHRHGRVRDRHAASSRPRATVRAELWRTRRTTSSPMGRRPSR